MHYSEMTSPYMVHLDTLRAFAVCGVMLYHFAPYIHGLHTGYLGVQLFFVLSGYLITGILLRCRDMVERTDHPVGVTIRRFYIRRFLRLFPAYYLMIGLAWITNTSDVRDHIWWYVTYLSNALFSFQGSYPVATAHLWSLAVEEQFYLIWPAVVLFCPRAALGAVILSVVSIGPLFRGVGQLVELNGIALYTLPFASADSLGLGALLAYAQTRPALRTWLLRLGRWSSLLVLLLILVGLFDLTSRPVFVLGNTVCALSFTWLVWQAAQGGGGTLGRWLAFPPLVYLGKVSYGIYLYHLFMPELVSWGLKILGLSPVPVGFWQLVLSTSATIAIAMLSWHLYEGPLNMLKKWFPYTMSSQQRLAHQARDRLPR